MEENATLQARLESRARELEADYERGQRTLAGLEAQLTSTREALLRIEGAITVLREQLAAADVSEPSVVRPGAAPSEPDLGTNGHGPQEPAAV